MYGAGSRDHRHIIEVCAQTVMAAWCTALVTISARVRTLMSFICSQEIRNAGRFIVRIPVAPDRACGNCLNDRPVQIPRASDETVCVQSTMADVQYPRGCSHLVDG